MKRALLALLLLLAVSVGASAAEAPVAGSFSMSFAIFDCSIGPAPRDGCSTNLRTISGVGYGYPCVIVYESPGPAGPCQIDDGTGIPVIAGSDWITGLPYLSGTPGSAPARVVSTGCDSFTVVSEGSADTVFTDGLGRRWRLAALRLEAFGYDHRLNDSWTTETGDPATGTGSYAVFDAGERTFVLPLAGVLESTSACLAGIAPSVFSFASSL